jgi:hypothetical protein
LDLLKPVQLIGDGVDKTEILSDAEDWAVSFSVAGLFAARGITFRQSGLGEADTVRVTAGEVDFVSCRFADAARKLYTSGVGLRLAGPVTGRVRECEATGNERAGILVEKGANVLLDSNAEVRAGSPAHWMSFTF